MKNLNEFKSFQIPNHLLKFLVGARVNKYCDALNACIATARRDGNEFLIDDCSATFGDGCVG